MRQRNKPPRFSIRSICWNMRWRRMAGPLSAPPGPLRGRCRDKRLPFAAAGSRLQEILRELKRIGMRAILIDREERHPEIEDRLTDLFGLPAALGLERPV